MGFINTVSGLFRPSFYFEEIRRRTVMRGAGFLFVWTVLVCGAVAAHYCIQALNQKEAVLEFGGNLEQELNVIYPAEMVLTFKDHELSTNVSQPYFIDFQTEPFQKFFPLVPEFFQQGGGVQAMGDTFEHLIAIDTGGMADNFLSYKSLILFTRTSLVVADKNHGVRVIFYKEAFEGKLEDFVIDDAKYRAFLEVLRPYIGMLPKIYTTGVIALAVCFPVFLAAFWVPWQMLYLVLFSLVVMVMAKIFGKPLLYSEAYVVSLYASAFPVAGVAGLLVAGVALPPFVSSVILLCVLGSVLLLGESAGKQKNLPN